jgi:hypothetical protein
MNNDTQLLIHELINKSLDGTITSSEFEELNRLIKSDPECAAYYVSSIRIHFAFSKAGCLFREHAGESLSDSSLSLQEFAEYEKTAPVVQIVKTKLQAGQRQDAAQPVSVRKISKLPIITAIVSCAALLMIFIYVYLNPQMSEVATLTDSIRPQWLTPENSVKIGSRLSTMRQPAMLEKGIIKILYDNDVEVLIEAPAQYQILSSREIALHRGRLFATVSPAGKGFTIKTQYTKIVDLGTKFGVQVDAEGETELHVIKGQTTLFAGSSWLAKKSQTLLKGQARRVAASGSEVREIPVREEMFVQSIHSETNSVWRGQKTIDLADIVGGGNGFEGGVLNTGIDVTTGKMAFRLVDKNTSIGSAGYRIAKNSPYIDGVFFPGTENGKTQIASDGSIAVQFPKTSGTYWGYIFNGAFHEGKDVPGHALQLDGVVFGKPDTPAITIHSNQGITFDLSKIRKNIPSGKIAQFRSLIGISETVQAYVARLNSSDRTDPAEMEKLLKATYSTADFWVFLDGKKVYEGKVSNSDKAVQLEIPITDGDRFLTLAVTEANDIWAYDWALFGRPKLMIESAQ